MRPLEELNALCERAARHKRRQLAGQGRSDIVLEMWIYHSTPFANLEPGPDGWTVLSILHDDLHGQRYRILWEPTTDRLRLQQLLD